MRSEIGIRVTLPEDDDKGQPLTLTAFVAPVVSRKSPLEIDSFAQELFDALQPLVACLEKHYEIGVAIGPENAEGNGA
jgi:hypothetical protein